MSRKREKKSNSLEKDLTKRKESDFRLKKHKNELHILKMSQEWDLRRQKRRMDRQKWVEERRKQQLPIWQRVGNLRVRANDDILHESGDIHVNNQVGIGNSNEEHEVRDKNTNEMKLERVKQNLLVSLAREANNTDRVLQSTNLPINQTYTSDSGKEVITKELRQRTALQWQHYKAAGPNETTPQIIECGAAHNILAETHTGNSHQEEYDEHGTSTNKEPDRAKKQKRELSPSTSKCYRKRKAEATSSNRNEIKLMCAEKTTTLGKIAKQGGVVTNISSTLGGLNPNTKDVEKMPQIKQCYSLYDHHDDGEVIFMGTTTSKSTSSNSPVATPTTKTSAPSEHDIQRSLPLPAAANAKCIVYLAKAATTPHIVSSSGQMQPGLILPVFKQSTRETAYAVLPAGASYLHQGGDSSVAEQRGLKSEGVTTLESSTLHPLSSTGSNEAQYTFAPETSNVVRLTQPQSHSSGENVQSNVTVQPVHEEKGSFLMQRQNYVKQTQPTPPTISGTYLERAHLVQDEIAGLASSTDQSVKDATSVAVNTPQRVAPPPYIPRKPELGSHQSGSTQEAIFNPNVQSNVDNIAMQPVHEERGSFLLQHQNHVKHTQPTPPTISDTYLERAHLVQDEIAGLTASADQSVKDATVAVNTPRRVAPPPYTTRKPELGSHQSGSTQEAIFNPMSLYVKARLVPREVVTPAFGTESPAAMIDYIKTDAICNKELTKWTAKNVADFVASTDCMDKANLFLDQEIDGKALLSLSLEMLMKGMNLKLGPAVKLYNHIANLRTALLL